MRHSILPLDGLADWIWQALVISIKPMCAPIWENEINLDLKYPSCAWRPTHLVLTVRFQDSFRSHFYPMHFVLLRKKPFSPFRVKRGLAARLPWLEQLPQRHFNLKFFFQFPIQSFINIAVADAVAIDIVTFPFGRLF